MEWLIAALAIVVLGVAAVVASGRGGSMPKDPVRDTYAMVVSGDPLDGEVVRGLRFGIALRGYAMDQVDAILDRLAADLDARDARIAELSARLGEADREAGPDATPDPEAVPVRSTADEWDRSAEGSRT